MLRDYLVHALRHQVMNTVISERSFLIACALPVSFSITADTGNPKASTSHVKHALMMTRGDPTIYLMAPCLREQILTLHLRVAK